MWFDLAHKRSRCCCRCWRRTGCRSSLRPAPPALQLFVIVAIGFWVRDPSQSYVNCARAAVIARHINELLGVGEYPMVRGHRQRIEADCSPPPAPPLQAASARSNAPAGAPCEICSSSASLQQRIGGGRDASVVVVFCVGPIDSRCVLALRFKGIALHARHKHAVYRYVRFLSGPIWIIVRRDGERHRVDYAERVVLAGLIFEHVVRAARDCSQRKGRP